MSVITLSEKLGNALDHLDKLNEIFDELPDVEQTLRWQEKVNLLRRVVRREKYELDKEALRSYRAAQLTLEQSNGDGSESIQKIAEQENATSGG